MSAEAARNANPQWLPSAESVSHQDPLLDCLVLLARLEHRPTSIDALATGLPIPKEGFTPELFVRAASRIG